MKDFVNVAAIKVWKEDDSSAPPFADDFQVAKFAMFRGMVGFSRKFCQFKLYFNGKHKLQTQCIAYLLENMVCKCI